MKTKTIFLLLIFILTIKGYGQEVNFTDTMVHFVIKKREFVSKKFRNIVNKKQKRPSKWGGNVPLGTRRNHTTF